MMEAFARKNLAFCLALMPIPRRFCKAVERQALKARNQDYMVEQFDQTARDFSSQLVSFSRRNVDAILIIGSFSEAGFAIKQGRGSRFCAVRWPMPGF